MTQLCDWQIRSLVNTEKANGINVIDPFDESRLQTASYDLTLGGQVRTENGLAYDLLDVSEVSDKVAQCRAEDMEPGRFLLAHTAETIHVPSHVSAYVHGKSTWARMGLQVHSAGFVDPGFHGQLTLELVNHSNLKHFKLYRGMKIAQITFHVLGGRPERPYGDPALGSHYQGQTGATAARRS